MHKNAESSWSNDGPNATLEGTPHGEVNVTLEGASKSSL